VNWFIIVIILSGQAMTDYLISLIFLR